MKIPKPISEFLERHMWIAVLIFGIFIGFVSANFIYKISLDSKNELIIEYRERLQIREKSEGPYTFYTDRELKDRAIELSRKIENLCEQNALLLISEHYQREYNEHKTNIKDHNSEPLKAQSGSIILGHTKERDTALDKIAPPITQNDVGRTYGDLIEDWLKNISKSIESEIKHYKEEYMQDAINLKEEMLLRMPPRAWRHYRFHVDPRNPGLYLIGVAIQLREIANDLIR